MSVNSVTPKRYVITVRSHPRTAEHVNLSVSRIMVNGRVESVTVLRSESMIKGKVVTYTN